MKRRIMDADNFRLLWAILCLTALASAVYFLSPVSSAQEQEAESFERTKQNVGYEESENLAAFRREVGGRVTPVIVELKDDPASVKQFRESLNVKSSVSAYDKIAEYAVKLTVKQDAALDTLKERGVRLMMRTNEAVQLDKSVRLVEYRFTYLLNGFVAYVATPDLELLKKQPEVISVSEIENTRFLLDHAIDYSLGTQMSIFDRRLAVYGANEELTPTATADHPETPQTTAIDGYEGQGINLAVIDSGIDWRHPMFGGRGNASPMPRVSGMPAKATDNRKVIYYYALSSPGDPTDDFGHGTLVSSSAAGYAVDGNTPPITGFGTGRDGTGIGPTISGARYHGTAPQARLMAYKVCGPAPQCAGDSALAMEDAASPYTLIQSGNQGPTPVSKPVADVINLSLGDTAGSATAASSKAANNAALNGTIVVASAGNAGPGAGTIGAPSAATLAISVAASLDPGSVAASDLLLAGEGPNDPQAGTTDVTTAGPAPETGAASQANASQPPTGLKIFPVAGGGAIPNGSLSTHYILNDQTAPNTVPLSVRNRIVLVKNFTGAFATAANMVAAQQPAAIILITATESATAVAVVNNIPTYTMSVANGNLLINQMLASGMPTNGTISRFPLRISQSASLADYQPAMASFSSRGPNDNPTANYRQVKPDVTGPGVGIEGAATPDGIPDDTVGLASTTGYTVANGTSFSGPITAGAMCVIRQRVRNELGLDTVNQSDTNYRLKRFDTVTVARALLQNSATNLRNGFGVPESDPAPTSSVNDVGSGHINVAGALALKAIMVSPTLLLADADSATTGSQSEFTAPTRNAPTLDSGGNLEVLLPTVSFGNQPIAGLQSSKVITRKVIVRDVTRGVGGGTYNLSFADNRNGVGTQNFGISFLAANGTTPTTTVRVPSGGQATFFVRVEANGGAVAPDTEFQWYVYATHATSGQKLRMPFYYRATAAAVPAGINAPTQTDPTNATTPGNATTCGTDVDGGYTINWLAPTGTAPIGYRVQEATSIMSQFSDPADTPLVNGANSMWSGSAQWTSQVNPSTTSLAYFVPDTAMQNEALAMVAPGITLTGTGASLSFLTRQSTEENFDFIYVEISNNNGATWNSLGAFTGVYTGTREFDLSTYVNGPPIRIRFRMVSDLIGPDTGTYIENIVISTNNFATLGDVAATPLNFAVSGRASGTRYYRIAGRFSTASGDVIGPFSNTRCVTVASLTRE